MKTLIYILLALLLAVGIASFASNSSGYLVLNYADWTMQISFTFFIVLLFLAFVVMYIILRLLINLWDIPKRIRRWKKHRQQRLSEKYLTRGLYALLEGNWRNAEVALNKGANFSRVPLINYLGAAKAAQKQRSLQRRDSYLKHAHESAPDARIAIGLTQAELQINQQQTEQALATLRHLHQNYPDNSEVKCMLLQIYIELKDWYAVLDLLPELGRKKLLAPESIKAKQLEAYAGLLQKAGQAADKTALDESWGQIPKKLRNEFHLLEVYTAEKIRFADTVGCEPLLRKALKRQWDESLIRLYGLIESNDYIKQLAFAESFLAGHARDPVLLLSLGRLCIRNNLWGKARGYLEESIEAKPMPESYHELAILLDKQGDHSGASVYYQQGLKIATATHYHDAVKLPGKDETQDIMCEGARQVV